jgi:hypothetical protein
MRTRPFAVAFTCCLIAACQRETPPAAKKAAVPVKVKTADASKALMNKTIPLDITALDRSAMGSKIDADGNVMESKEVYKAGEPVYVTMWLRLSPGGLQTSVHFLDAKQREVAWPKKQMNGAKIATFKLDTAKLAPGEYSAICYWGLDDERDYKFRIEKAVRTSRGARAASGR